MEQELAIPDVLFFLCSVGVSEPVFLPSRVRSARLIYPVRWPSLALGRVLTLHPLGHVLILSALVKDGAATDDAGQVPAVAGHRPCEVRERAAPEPFMQ